MNANTGVNQNRLVMLTISIYVCLSKCFYICHLLNLIFFSFSYMLGPWGYVFGDIRVQTYVCYLRKHLFVNFRLLCENTKASKPFVIIFCLEYVVKEKIILKSMQAKDKAV